MRAHKLISNPILASNMRPINVTLDSVTWELAKQKTNFSAWVRAKLRSEDNKISPELQRMQRECVLGCGRPRTSKLYCDYHAHHNYIGEEQ